MSSSEFCYTSRLKSENRKKTNQNKKKMEKYFDLARELKKYDKDTNCTWDPWNNVQEPGT